VALEPTASDSGNSARRCEIAVAESMNPAGGAHTVETSFDQLNRRALLRAIRRPSGWPGEAQVDAGTQTGTHGGSDVNLWGESVRRAERV